MTIPSIARPAALALTTTATLLVGGFAGSARADVPSCHGMPATIVATSGTASGTPGNDVIVASGYTSVDAGAGDDTICVDGIVPSIDAGPGNDYVDARSLEEGVYLHADLGSGSDTFFGGSETDAVDAGSGLDNDVISTGDNRDLVTISTGHADVSTGNGKDRVMLESGGLLGGNLKLGRAEDRITIDDPQGGVVAALGHRNLAVDDVDYSLVGVEDVFATADSVHLAGDRHRNVLVSYGCHQKVVGRGNDDRIKLAGPSDSSLCSRAGGKAFGGPGRDVLRSNQGRVALYGGPEFDKAIGDGRGGTTCYAERTRGCR